MEIDNGQNVIDSRDVIERIAELEELEGEKLSDDPEEHAVLAEENADELQSLRNLAEQANSAADWQHGETLIRDTFFEDYTAELIDDCYELPKSTDWPYRHLTLDIEAAAAELQQDYFDVDFDGVTYWIR